LKIKSCFDIEQPTVPGLKIATVFYFMLENLPAMEKPQEEKRK